MKIARNVFAFSTILICAGTLYAAAASDSRSDLERVRTKIAILEAQLKLDHPELQSVEAEYKRLKADYEQQINLNGQRGDVSAYVNDEAANGLSQSRKRSVDQLRYRWAIVRMTDTLKNPKTEPLLKAVITSKPQFMKFYGNEVRLSDAQMQDAETFWRNFKSEMLGVETLSHQYVKDILNLRPFPAYVAMHAKLSAFSRFDLEMVYFPYIELLTPEALRDARREEKKLLMNAGTAAMK